MRRSFGLTAIALFLVSLILAAADVSGTWTGTIDIRHGDEAPISTPVQLRLESSGSGITGEIWRDGDEEKVPIQNVRVEGAHVSFEAASNHTKGPMRFHLTLDGSRLTGEMIGEVEQGRIAGRVTLTRGA